MHILIAEDQEMSRTILANHLRSWGHQVIEAADGAEALSFLAKINFNIDMLITDWGMPNIDGLELARQVRELSSAGQYIYTILLTGHGELEDKIQAFSLGGVDDFVTKPFEASELQMRIHVGNRVVRAERTQRLYSQSLERLVRQQTEAIHETQREIIERLFNALESRDHETGSHVQRIGTMSAFIGKILGWESEQLDAISLAAPLHDIGKIAVSDNILLKPGGLTPDEFNIIKRHAIIGANILSNSRNPVVQMAETIAHYHHENWDGSGYPEGRKGTDIPIEPRVVAIVDVYDALLSDRVYRPALPEKTVLDILLKERGKKFDPDICDALFDNITEFRRAVKISEQTSGLYSFAPAAFA